MSHPKLFIGSSERNLRVAKALADGLENCADVKVWDEGVFSLNQGFLETLQRLKGYDFAVFVLAADDTTTSKDETKPSPRDNVLFESGLFMGMLGRERVFLVYDGAAGLKLPSDFAGITLATYDGNRIEEDVESAVRKACRLISDQIKLPRNLHLVGEWRSIYPMTFEDDNTLSDEVVEIKPCGTGITIASKISPNNDHYTAEGRLFGKEEDQIIGEWKSDPKDSATGGVFILKVSAKADFMYGYFTSPGEKGVVYASWILVKKSDVDEATVNKWLKKAQKMLAETVGISLPDSVA
jgi:hypothetical protein